MFDNQNTGYHTRLSAKYLSLSPLSMRLPISSLASAALSPLSTQTHILHKSPNPRWIVKVVHQEDKSAINDLAGMLLEPGNKKSVKNL